MTNDLVFIASGKLGFPAKAAMAFAMGAGASMSVYNE